MAESSWPSPDDSRDVSDLEYEQLVAGYVPSGLIGSPGDTAVVTADGSDREVIVRLGKYGYVRGHVWYSGTSNFTVAIAANASGNPRIDLVVLRLTRSTWNVTVEVVQGTPGVSPAVPALTQDLGTTGVYEIPIANVAVANGATVITAGNVTAVDYYLSRSRWCGVAANRPDSGTYIDQQYFSTDTGEHSRWTGTEWVPDSSARIGAATRTSTVTMTSVETIVDSVTVTVPSGRRHRLIWSGTTYMTAAGESYDVRIRYAAGATVTSSGTLLVSRELVCPAINAATPTTIVYEFTGVAAGQTTFGVFGVRTYGSGTVTFSASANGKAQISIDDIGV
jgi:hypothetical protein